MPDAGWLEQQAPNLHFFLDCVQRQTTKFSLQADCLHAIMQICHLVEGNPLAIELAAGLAVHYTEGFSRNAALAITGGHAETLVTLVNKSLVRSKGGGRYEIPRLIRLFATQWRRMVENECDQQQLHAAHATYYLSYLQQQFDKYTQTLSSALLATIQHEIGNLHNACSWIYQYGSPKQRQQCASLLSTLHHLKLQHGYLQLPDWEFG